MYLITGCAGFIGFHFCIKLLKTGNRVIGIDNLNNYYDLNLKKDRLVELEKFNKGRSELFKFHKCSLEDESSIFKIFKDYKPEYVINLAAQAGVRYSLENPSAYIQSNVVGFNNIIEACKNNHTKHLIYASSSSVYGGNKKMPFSESDAVNHPLSLYAATKRSNELLAHSYSHIYGLAATGLRFFTVYGPWGRPDMALFLFTKAIIEKRPIKIFNNGNMIRDFTYIDDIVESLYLLLNKVPRENKNFSFKECNPSKSFAPHRIFNIGNSNPVKLMEFINEIENKLGIKSIKEYLPMQPGDVEATFADTRNLEELINFKPKTSVKEGVDKFINWYKFYYKV